MSRNKLKHKQHQINLEGQVGKLTAYTKKGKPIVAIFDAIDIDKIDAFKNWRAVWCAEFDSPVIESKDFKDGRAIRTPVAAAILGCSPNAPIHHKNVDFLDNRRSNLEIYDVKAQPNDYEIDGCVAMILKDRCGYQTGVCYLDVEDLDLVINSGHVWFKKRRASGQPYVVNQDGLLLAHYLLGVSGGFVTYLNKNPLDNRRENITIDISVNKAENLQTKCR